MFYNYGVEMGREIRFSPIYYLYINNWKISLEPTGVNAEGSIFTPI
jgi:hypothetical protein